MRVQRWLVFLALEFQAAGAKKKSQGTPSPWKDTQQKEADKPTLTMRATLGAGESDTRLGFPCHDRFSIIQNDVIFHGV